MFALATAAMSSAAMVLPNWKTAEAGKSTSGKGELQIEGKAAVKCEEGEGSFTNETEKRLGKYTLTFKNCTQGGEPCLSLGGTAGTVVITAEWHLVLLEKPSMKWLIDFLLPSADPHIECLKSAVHLLLVLGSVLGLVLEAENEKAEFKIDVETENGLQKLSEFENNSGAIVKNGLEVSQEGGKQKKAGLLSLNNILKFGANNKVEN